MSPANLSPPVRQGYFAGRVTPRPGTPQPLQPWAGDASAGYVPVGYENAPGYTGSLADGSGLTITSGNTYSFYHDPGNGTIGTTSVPVSNVTFYGCAFTGAGVSAACAVLDGSNITFRYCTFQPGPFASYPPSSKFTPVAQSAGPQWGFVADGTAASPGTFNSYCTGLTLDHCEAWGFGNGMAKLAEGSSQSSPYVVSYCWMHDHRANTSGTDHQDGIGSPGGGSISWLQMDHCQVNESSATADTGAIAWAALPSGNSFDHCTLTGNLFGGYGFTLGLYVPASVTNLTFTGNTFSTQYSCAFGPIYDDTITSQAGFTWHGNKWHVPPGAAWGHTAYDGYFWLPVFTSNAAVAGFDELTHGLVGTSDF